MSVPVAVLAPRRLRPPVEPSPWIWRPWRPELIAAICSAPVDAVRANWPLVYRALAQHGAVSPANCAAALATIAIETASTFQPVREAYWLDEQWRRNNLRYYPWYGRGYIQLTWRPNYHSAGNAIGVDLIRDPDRAMEPEIAAQIFAWYWTVASPMLPIRADEHDWREVRRLVQGGSDGLPRLMGICAGLLRSVT